VRDEIEQALGPLVALPLCYASHAVDMGTFGFGAETEQVHRGKSMTVADYRLHIQEVWRIVRDGVVLVGYGDWRYPPRGWHVEREDFVPHEAKRSRRDDLIDDWSGHDAADHIVRDVRGTHAGDIAVSFRDGCALETFISSVTADPDDYNERWRLIPPWAVGDEPHFVVTAHGIER
jgi:hypothetical protein